VKAAAVVCAACGAKVRGGRVKCLRCGEKLVARHEALPPRPIPWTTVGVVAGCVVLGGFGIMLTGRSPEGTTTPMAAGVLAGSGTPAPAAPTPAPAEVAPAPAVDEAKLGSLARPKSAPAPTPESKKPVDLSEANEKLKALTGKKQ